MFCIIAKSLSNSRNYDRAIFLFNDALVQVVDEDDALKVTIMKSKSETFNDWANHLEENFDFEGAISKFKDAVKSAVNETDRKQFQSGLLKAHAKSLYAKALTLWNEAWVAENNDEVAKATAKFMESSSLVLQASNMDPTNRDYQRLSNECSFKIEGNAFFNDGLKLREEANKLRIQQRYNEALSKNREALKKFQEGYDLGNDERFKNCIDIVTDVINDVSDIVEALISSVVIKNNISTSADESNLEKNVTQTIRMIS